MAKRIPTSLGDVPRVVGYVWSHPANRGRRLRQLARVIRFRARAALGRSTTVPLGGSGRIEARLDQPYSILVAYSNPPDFVEWRVWKEYLRPGDVFVDVGANIGVYSILAAELGCRVVAYEPDEANRTQLMRNLELSGLAGRVDVRPVALSDHFGEVRFLIGEGPLARIAADGDVASNSVPCRPLDSEGIGAIAGIKIDVEGAEDQVLRGASGILAGGHCKLIQLEWNDQARLSFGRSRQDEADIVAQAGYRLVRPDASGQLRPTDGHEGSDVFAYLA